ncbi:MAG: helix-turn-helix domain-containing protein [Porcipelethomonas sp.]
MIKLPLNIFTQDESFPFFIQYGEHKEDLYMHSHENFSELVIVLSGSAEHIVDNENYRISKGDVFVISDETVHGYANVKDFRICNIMFEPMFFITPELDIAESAGFQALFVLEPHCSRTKHFASRLKLDFNAFIQINHLIEKLYREYTEKQTGWKTMVKSDFLNLAVVLSRLYNVEKITDETGIIKLAEAIAYIEKNYAEPISVSGLARLSNYSERQFIRLFKETLGCIPIDYITNLRMQKARELLKTSSLPIAEIASRCGYNDSNYFSRIFKKHNAETPSEYRINFRK